MAGPVKTVSLKLFADSAEAQRKLDSIMARAEELKRLNPTISVKLDKAAAQAGLAVLRAEMRKTGDETVTLKAKIDKVTGTLQKGVPAWTSWVSAGIALGPAILPVIGVVTAGVVALGGAVASAGIGLGAFGLLAKQNLTIAATAATKVEHAQNVYNAALKAGTKQSTAYKAEQKAIALAYAQMSPQQIALSKSVNKLQNAWQAVQASTAPLVSSALVPWMGDIEKLLGLIKPLITPIAGQFRQWGIELGHLIGSNKGKLKEFIGTFAIHSLINIHNFGVALIDFARGAGRLIHDIAPNIGGASKGIAGLAASFATWAGKKSTADAITHFFADMHKVAPQVGQFLGNIVKILPVLVAGLLPLAPVSLTISRALTGLIAKIPPRVITALAIGFLAWTVAIRGLVIILKAWKIVQIAIDAELFANPIGLVVLAVAALVAGLILLYKHSKLFREIVQTVWGWIKVHWPELLAIMIGPIAMVVAFVVRNFTTIKRVIGGVIANIADVWLGLVLIFLRGLEDIAKAASHLPGFLGSPFKRAAVDIQGAIDKVTGLKRNIDTLRGKNVGISVTGKGTWSIFTGPTPVGGIQPGGKKGPGRAMGGLITGGIPGVDSVPLLGQRGEVVVPVPMVNAGAVDHLRGRLPGFKAGGMVGPYHGGLPGLGPWMQGGVNATLLSLERAVAAGTLKGLRSMPSPGGGAGFPGGGIAVGGAQNYARSILGLYGWGAGEFGPLQALWNRESGWRWNATNPTSGAYGIPQSLPASKMAAAGADWLTNPATQIRWGEGYIKGRYGSPTAAWGHELGFGWYDRGGYLPKGLSLALNTTGRPERVGGGGQHVVLEFRGGGHGKLERALISWFCEQVHIRGGGSVEAAFGS